MFKLFRKKNYNTNKVFKLSIIDENALQLHDVLGINDKRKREIGDLVEKATALPKLHMTIQKVYEGCYHENEIAYATLLIGRYHDKGKNEISMFMKILENLD